MSPRRTSVVVDRPAESPAVELPGVADENHYRRLVPRYATTSADVETAEAAVRAIEDRIGSADRRRAEAITAGDYQGALAAEADRQDAPVELHVARIALAVARERHFLAETDRIRAEAAGALRGHAERIGELQRAVLAEAALIREACNAAEVASSWCGDQASQAAAEARRLRSVDPIEVAKNPWTRNRPHPEWNEPAETPAMSIEHIVIGHVRDQQNFRLPVPVVINHKPILRLDEAGNPRRYEGFRIRRDDVLIDDNDQPILNKDGTPRRHVEGPGEHIS